MSTKSKTPAAKSTNHSLGVAPAVKVVQNPANATARTTYEPVVHSTGTIGGKPARLAWYGTKYGCIEIEQADGSFVVHHDTAFGGMRSVNALEGLFDSVVVAPAVDVLVLGGDMREIQLTAGNVAVVEPEIVEVVAAEPVEVELDPVDFAQAEANIAAAFPAPVVATEPVYTTLDEVRAAHEAETRDACRASVLRALRVRAGEIALGVTAGGKVAKATVAPRARPATPWADAVAARFASDTSPLTAEDGVALGLPPSAFKFSGGWAPAGSLGAALAAKGLCGKLRKGAVVIGAIPAA